MEEQPQPLEKETAEINGSKTHRLRVVIVFLFLLTVFLVSVYTFILQRNYSENTLESAVEWNTQCADAIYKLVLQKLTGEDYKNISTIADMQSERYQRLQKELSELRKLNPTRYLYTAKMGADGRPIYLIDGLDLDAKDFAYPGTYIEKEMVPYIEAALAGETVYSQEIVDTAWGHIFTACYPVREDTGEVIGAICMEMDMEHTYYPEKPLVPFIKATQDRIVLEIQRGCIRGCRFCQAGMIYRPNREKNVERLKELAQKMIASTGHEEISLSSLSSSDYSQLEELINFLIDECDKKNINISLPSLRIDAFSLDIMQKVQDIKKSSLTFAPEAGSQRLRNVINKGLTVEDILGGAGQAFEGGWNKVKLYFMLGLPTETEEDMRAIPELANQIAALYYDIVPKEKRNGKCQITISTSFFVPKPFTPFQWASMLDSGDYLGRAKIVNDHVKEQLNHKSIRYNWHEADVTVLEGVLARGDRRLSSAIHYVYEHGGIFDAWSDFFNYDLWLEAFRKCDIDIDFYTKRVRSEDEIFPWDFIDVGVTKAFMLREWKTALSETVTPNCRMRCSGCGAKQFGGGVCFEDKN